MEILWLKKSIRKPNKKIKREKRGKEKICKKDLWMKCNQRAERQTMRQHPSFPPDEQNQRDNTKEEEDVGGPQTLLLCAQVVLLFWKQRQLLVKLNAGYPLTKTLQSWNMPQRNCSGYRGKHTKGFVVPSVHHFFIRLLRSDVYLCRDPQAAHPSNSSVYRSYH